MQITQFYNWMITSNFMQKIKKIRMKILASKLSEPIGQLYVKSIDDPSVDDHKYPRVIFLQKMRR